MLERYLPDERMVRVVRTGYPTEDYSESKNTRRQGPLTENSILLGYSWGVVSCLREGAQYVDRVQAMILVSPFLFPSRPIELIKQILLRTPVIGEAFLKRAGREIIDQMLEKTSSPQSVPVAYREVAEKLSDPRVLRQAVLEKEAKGEPVHEAFAILAGAKIPVAVIWGAEDNTCKASEQIKSIRRCIPVIREECLENAGHATLWTHPKELAEAIQRFLEQVTREAV